MTIRQGFPVTEAEMSKLTSVLYVEDEPDIREITTLAMKMMGGLQVHGAGDGRTALALAQAHTFDLLLLDRHLPDMSGTELLEALRELPGKEAQPVVVMSGRPLEPEERAEIEHLLGEITKPFQPETLCNRLQDMWANR